MELNMNTYDEVETIENIAHCWSRVVSAVCFDDLHNSFIFSKTLRGLCVNFRSLGGLFDTKLYFKGFKCIFPNRKLQIN